MVTHFFQHTHNSQKDNFVLDASPRQDGFVRALALTIVDRIISRDIGNTRIVSLLVDKLKYYFPKSVPNASYASPIETLELMTNTPLKASRTALELTWALRQLMIDAMCRKPKKYLTAFYQHGDVTTPTEMRHSGIPINKIGLTTLAELLDMTIVVHQTEKNKQLPAKLKYGVNKKVHIDIDENDNRFSPRVKNKKVFRPLNSIANVNPKSDTNTFQDDNIVKQVRSSIHNIIQTNNENVSWLKNMLEDGNLLYKDLLDLYIANAEKMTWEKEFVEPTAELKVLLVNAVATMISFGLLSRQELFAEEVIEPSSPSTVS